MSSLFAATFLRPFRWQLAVAALASVAAVAAALAQPLAMQRLFDVMAQRGPWPTVLAVLAGLVIGEAVLTGLQTVLLQRAGSDAVLAIRSGLSARLLRWPLERYRAHPRGELVTLLTTDTSRMHAFVTGGIFEVAASGLMAVGALVLMAWISPLLLAVAGASVVLVVVAVALTSSSVRQRSRQAQDATATMGSALDSGLDAVRTIRAAGATDLAEAAVLAPAKEARDASVALGNRLAVVNPLAQLATQGAFFAVVAVGAGQVGTGGMSAGDLLTFLLYVVLLLAPVESGVRAVPLIQQSRGSWDRIREALRAPVEPAATRPAVDAPGSQVGAPPPQLRFRQVGFAHEGRPVLTDVDLVVPPGSRLLLTGPSGVGKSTLLDLASGLVDPAAGRVEIDRVDVRGLDRAALSRTVAYLEQAAPVLTGTLGDNVRTGRREAGHGEVRDALEEVGLGHLAQTPAGLDLPLGAGGTQLSGGEAQRLALARALLSPARLLLIDEPTSRLDRDSESRVYAAIALAARSRTVVLVAHRFDPAFAPTHLARVVHGGRVEVEELAPPAAHVRQTPTPAPDPRPHPLRPDRTRLAPALAAHHDPGDLQR